jgi:hypothetical protein
MVDKKSYPVELVGGDRYASKEEARQAGLQPIAQAVAQAIRAGLESGRYVIVDGVVVPANSASISQEIPEDFTEAGTTTTGGAVLAVVPGCE